MPENHSEVDCVQRLVPKGYAWKIKKTQIKHQSTVDTFCPSPCDKSKHYQCFLLRELYQNQTLYKYSQLPSILSSRVTLNNFQCFF